MKQFRYLFLAFLGSLVLVGIIFGIGWIPSLGNQAAEAPVDSSSDPHASMHTPVATSDFSFQDAVGKQAPDFELSDLDGKTVQLSDYKGKTVVLFFNEGEMCYPACWNQMSTFASDKRFNTDSVVVFSIVADSKESWKTITSKTNEFANARILLDSSKTVSNAYGVLTLPSSMHPGTLPGHTYVVVDPEGVISYAFDDVNMAIRNDDIAKVL